MLLVLVSVVLDVITLQVTVEPVAEDGTVDKVLYPDGSGDDDGGGGVDLVTFILPLLLLTILKLSPKFILLSF